MASRAVSNVRKKRGVVRRSVTVLGTRLAELEESSRREDVGQHAQQLSDRLRTLNSDFKSLHFELIELIDEGEEDVLTEEQTVMDKHDQDVDSFTIRIKRLLDRANPAATNGRKSLSRKLTCLDESLKLVSDAVKALPAEVEDLALIQQYQEELRDHKDQLSQCRELLSDLELEERDALLVLHSKLKKIHFDCCHAVRKMLNLHESPPTTSSASVPPVDEPKGLKIPKLEAPTFDGDILNWTKFWEQFSISIDKHSRLTNAEKFVYLQHSLKGGSAKHVIEGLSGTGEHYSKAVECLKTRYDRPRLIHQSHVKVILEVPSLKDSSGKELRKFHDTLQQHLRALDAAECEPLSQFITSIIQLKLDVDTLFEWQKHTQDTTDVPHFSKILEFIDLRARASETTTPSHKRSHKVENPPKKDVASFVANSESPGGGSCCVCKNERHPLYHCSKFKDMPHDQKLTVVRSNNLCMNCLKNGHYLKDCKSSHHCKTCQKPHHTLLHVETPKSPTVVSGNTATGIIPDVLLMTCQVLVKAPDGSKVRVRALLDSASSSSFVSERLVQNLCIPRSHHEVTISGVAGLSDQSPLRAVATVDIAPTRSSKDDLAVIAVVVPKVTCELPLHPVNFKSSWTHLNGITLADPDFGRPGRIDLLLGVDVYVEALLHGRRSGPPGSPIAFETIFGWVLAGRSSSVSSQFCVATHHVTAALHHDDILRKFWELEELPRGSEVLPMEERNVLNHFRETHSRNSDGRFVVPLPRRPGAKPLGESRSQALRRFMSLECLLQKRNRHNQFNSVMKEYLDLGHAELVPSCDLKKPEYDVFYLPVHVVYKDSSTTTKVRAVFDASAKSVSNVSLNDCLLAGPTVHSPLIDVLLRFRLHRIAVTTDISKMYRAIELVEPDRDLHRFLWRPDPSQTIKDYRMTRVTFGVSSSSFIANMCIKQNAIDLAHEFPLAANAVEESFYVDDGLTGADDIQTAIQLQKQLQDLFSRGGFLLHKWNSNEPIVLQHVDRNLCELGNTQEITDTKDSTKTLGLEWITDSDQFRLTVSQFSPHETPTKRILVSDIARVFDALGWFSPAILKAKVLLQRCWERKINWDDPVPTDVQETWRRWRTELPGLLEKTIPRCYFPKESLVTSTQLHGFSDASEDAYSAVVYLRIVDSQEDVHISLVTSKTKVSPIKRQSIPRLELCGALLLARLIDHTREVLGMSLTDTYAWTDSTIVLHWLDANPRQLKTFVGNRVSLIINLIPPEHWKHVPGIENPSDCASRGLFPGELVLHDLWWNGSPWLGRPSDEWPSQPVISANPSLVAEEEVCHVTACTLTELKAVVSPDQYSSFERLQRVTAWVVRFVNNSRLQRLDRLSLPYLTVPELFLAESYLCSIVQSDCFRAELGLMKSNRRLPKGNCLLPLSPFIDTNGVLRVGGRQRHSNLLYLRMHPVILHAKHSITRLLINSEHRRLLHGGPTLMISSLSRRYHILRVRQAVRAVTHRCTVCRRWSAKPTAPLLGQLPIERLTPGTVFDKTGIDYAGPIYIKYGHVRKPVVTKAYVCVFVSLTVKAVHLELASDLSSEAFIACLRRFVSRRGFPLLLWSDHGSNFIGANRELKEFVDFLETQKVQKSISEFCSARKIEWKFIPEHSPHFGGIWEAAVKSFKNHLRRVMGEVKLTFEEMTTVLVQIEACLNSRPLVPISSSDEDSIEALTPGHFLIGQPLTALPDPAFSYRSVSLLRRWHLCQHLVRHFWKRWSLEYLTTLQKSYKWQHPTRNLEIDDLVVLIEDGVVPTKWPLARVTKTYPGSDGVVRVADVKTSKGSYRRPVHKLAALLPAELE